MAYYIIEYFIINSAIQIDNKKIKELKILNDIPFDNQFAISSVFHYIGHNGTQSIATQNSNTFLLSYFHNLTEEAPILMQTHVANRKVYSTKYSEVFTNITHDNMCPLLYNNGTQELQDCQLF